MATPHGGQHGRGMQCRRGRGGAGGLGGLVERRIRRREHDRLAHRHGARGTQRIAIDRDDIGAGHVETRGDVLGACTGGRDGAARERLERNIPEERRVGAVGRAVVLRDHHRDVGRSTRELRYERRPTGRILHQHGFGLAPVADRDPGRAARDLAHGRHVGQRVVQIETEGVGRSERQRGIGVLPRAAQAECDLQRGSANRHLVVALRRNG